MLDEWAPYRSDNATVRLRVVGFPHAAGNALFYRSLRAYLPLDIDFCPVELPGHGRRIEEMPFTHLDALTATLQVVLEPLLTVPFAFFGHSTGASIAFEAARVLRAADGRSAMHLFVSGRPAPGHASERRSILSLSDQDLVAALLRYGGTPAAVMERADLRDAVLSTLRNDLALVENHRPTSGIRLACPITAFGGMDDTIDRVSLRAWSEFTAATFRFRMFPGGHFYMSDIGQLLADEIVRDLCLPEALQAPRFAGAAI